jgi:hypothetical protein
MDLSHEIHKLDDKLPEQHCETENQTEKKRRDQPPAAESDHFDEVGDTVHVASSRFQKPHHPSANTIQDPSTSGNGTRRRIAVVARGCWIRAHICTSAATEVFWRTVCISIA